MESSKKTVKDVISGIVRSRVINIMLLKENPESPDGLEFKLRWRGDCKDLANDAILNLQVTRAIRHRNEIYLYVEDVTHVYDL